MRFPPQVTIALSLLFSINALCGKPPAVPRWVWVKSERVKGAKSTRSSVVEIATKDLNDRKFDTNKYYCRGVMYSPDTKDWFIGFEPKEKSDRVIGSDIAILVNDRNGSTRMIPGM